MTQQSIKIFIEEINSKRPKHKYATNKTDVYHIEDIWSLVILDLKVYGTENNRKQRYCLVIIDSFSKYGRTNFSKTKMLNQPKTPLKVFLYIQKENQILSKLIEEKNFTAKLFFKVSEITKTINFFQKLAFLQCFCRTL